MSEKQGDSTEFQSSTYLLGFAVALFLGIFSVLWVNIRWLPPPVEDNENHIDIRLAESSISEFIDRSTKTAKISKERKQFWGFEMSEFGTGIGLKVLDSPELFQAVFPGYPAEMRKDHELWKLYFQNKFNTPIYVSSLEPATKFGVQVVYSWTGCFQIIDRYGADVIIIGNSEVFRATSPDHIARTLGNTGKADLQNLRVLHCSTGAMTLQSMLRTAKEINRLMSAEKIKFAVLGLSLWHLNPNKTVHEIFNKEQEEIYSHYQPLPERSQGILASLNKKLDACWPKRNFAGLYDLRPSQCFKDYNWNSFSSIRLAEFTDSVIRRMKSKFRTPSPDNLVKRKTIQKPKEEQFPIIAIEDNNKAKQLIESAYFGKKLESIGEGHAFYGINSANCTSTNIEKVSEIVSELQKSFEHILVMTSKITPVALLSVPNCFVESVYEDLKKLESTHITVNTESWLEFGLQYTDFLMPDGAGTLVLNADHTNLIGTKTVSEGVANALLKLWNRDEVE